MDNLETLQFLNKAIAARSHQVALVGMKEDEKEEVWIGKQLTEESIALAQGLLRDGLKPRDRVALIANNSPDWIVACLAILQTGAVCVPIDAQFSNKQLTQVLEASKPARAFVSEKLLKRFEELKMAHLPKLILLDDKEDSRHWRHLKQQGETQPFEQVAADETAVIFFTSGTTGPPKGVPLTHKNLIHQLTTLHQMKLVREQDRMLLPLPLHHVYPFTMGLLVPLYLGVRIVLPGSITSSQITLALKEQHITIVIGIPRLYRALLEGINRQVESLSWPIRPFLKGLIKLSTLIRQYLNLNLGRFILFRLHQEFAPHLKILISGGAPLQPGIAMKLEGLGWKLGTGYGLTETSPLLTIIPPGGDHWDSVGKAIEGVSIRIAKVEDKEQEFGEVLAKGPNVFSGYLHDPKKTQEAFTEDGWFRTGDRGKLDEKGFLYLAGRVSTLIVTEAGENIQPDIVEEVYEEHLAIEEIGILKREGSLVAVVVPKAKEDKDKLAEALKQIAQTLPSYQRLKGFEISRNTLPRTRLGKIRRQNLAELYDKLCKGEVVEQPAKPIAIEKMSEEDQELLTDEAARKTWEMLAKRFANSDLSPDTNLELELGVDSLEWLNLTFEIRDCCAVMLNEDQISGIDTIRDLLKAIAEEKPQQKSEKNVFLENPESVLSKEQLSWLRPQGRILRLFARIGFSLNRLLFKLYFRLETKGEKNIDTSKACLITPNHSSYLDAPAIAAAISNKTMFQLHWIGLAETMLDNPIIRFVTRSAHVLPVQAHEIGTGLAFGATVLHQGKPLVWFPEGRRSIMGKLQQFQPGIGILADYFKTPIIPVYIEGTYRALPPGKSWPRRHKIIVHFGEALEPKQLEKEGEGDEPYQRIIHGLYKRMSKRLNK